jgi:hypothetical protein
MDYAVDPVKQSIARSWPGVIDDSLAPQGLGVAATVRPSGNDAADDRKPGFTVVGVLNSMK